LIMSSWTTHCRIPAQEYRQADEQRREELITTTERRVRTTLRGALDHDVEIATGWHASVVGTDPTASEFHVNGPRAVDWTPGQDVPDAAAELVCRGRTVT
jgi:hypothetical protein